MRQSLFVVFVVMVVGSLAYAKPPASSAAKTSSARNVPKSQASVASTPAGASQQTVTPLSAVSYENGLLSIAAENASLRQIMEQVRAATGAAVEVPYFEERISVHLGPQPPATVLAGLLEGSHLNFIIVGDPTDAHIITVIQITPEPAARPQSPAPLPSKQEVEAAQEAARQRALFVNQTGGDEGVWDNSPEH